MSKTTDTKQLFQTFTFKKGIETKNRIAMAPMTTWVSNDISGELLQCLGLINIILM